MNYNSFIDFVPFDESHPRSVAGGILWVLSDDFKQTLAFGSFLYASSIEDF